MASGNLQPGDQVEVASDGVIICKLTVKSVDEDSLTIEFVEKIPSAVCAGCEMRWFPAK